MKIPCFAALLALLFLCLTNQTSKAQTSIYGTVSLTNYGYAFNGNSLIVSKDEFGLGGGAFYNFPIQSRLTAGIDARGDFAPEATGGGKVFVSARFGFVPHRNPLRPYLQIGGGLIHAKVPRYSNLIGAQTINKGALDLALGLDLRLTPSLDYRLLELESGAGASSATSAASASLSTGIVYHFPSSKT